MKKGNKKRKPVKHGRHFSLYLFLLVLCSFGLGLYGAAWLWTGLMFSGIPTALYEILLLGGWGLVILPWLFLILIPLLFLALNREVKRDRTLYASIAKTANKIAAGKLRARFPVEGDDAVLRAVCEDLNRAVASLEAAERSNTILDASAVHDLKVPLAVIAGYADALRTGAVPKEKEEGYLETISSEARRLSEMVSSILTVERLRSGEKHLDPRGIDLAESARRVLLSFEGRIAEKGLSVDFSDADASVVVLTEEDALTRVLTNLVDNAVKFSKTGGRLSVTLSKNEGVGVLIVENECESVSEETLSHAFDRFYTTREGNPTGSGLGLYSAKGIVEAYGGSIVLARRDGASVAVTVSLPLDPLRAD